MAVRQALHPTARCIVLSVLIGMCPAQSLAHDIAEGTVTLSAASSIQLTSQIDAASGVVFERVRKAWALVAGIGRRSASFPDATQQAVHLATYTQSAPHFPFDAAGVFISAGAGYTTVDYECMVGEELGLGLQFTTERHQFDGPLHELRTYVLCAGLRLYLQLGWRPG